MKPHLRKDSDSTFRQVLAQTVEQDARSEVYHVHDKEKALNKRFVPPFKHNAKKGGGTVMLLLPITLDSCR